MFHENVLFLLKYFILTANAWRQQSILKQLSDLKCLSINNLTHLLAFILQFTSHVMIFRFALFFIHCPFVNSNASRFVPLSLFLLLLNILWKVFSEQLNPNKTANYVFICDIMKVCNCWRVRPFLPLLTIERKY